MKRKHVLHALLILFILICSGSVMTQAAPQDDDVYVLKSGSKAWLCYTKTKKKVKNKKGVVEMPAKSGNFYYVAGSSGRIYCSGWFTKNGHNYYANSNGRLARGWTTLDKKAYFFCTAKKYSCIAASGWGKLNGKRYYFDDKNVLQKGFRKIGKYYYYFDPKKNGAMTIGGKSISNKYYYFNKKGRMQTGIVQVGKHYFFHDTKGVRQTGLIQYKNHYYLFNEKTGGMCLGWRYVGANHVRYYFSKSQSSLGQAVTGWLTYKGKKYYFNENGAQATGFTTIGGSTYYFNNASGYHGEMMTGKQKIGSVEYDFGKNGKMVVNGDWNIRVNLSTNVVTIYRGTTPVKAMISSPGASSVYSRNGILGVKTKIMDHLRWHELMGPSWGQYCEHIASTILFHSIPYNIAYDRSSMAVADFKALGQAVSHGCIRLACIDAYYIYQNCPVGTSVIINWFGNTDPIAPTRYTISSNKTYDYDPTDPLGRG